MTINRLSNVLERDSDEKLRESIHVVFKRPPKTVSWLYNPLPPCRVGKLLRYGLERPVGIRI